MKKGYAVLSALGPDRVGIVKDISSVIKDFSCNIEESRMINLGGEFAVIMLLDGSENDINQLVDNSNCWKGLEDLHITLKKTTPSHTKKTGIPYLIKTLSLNTPGIVHAVTNLLQEKGLSIIELETDTSAAPFTGSPMFSMHIEFITESMGLIDQLREDLHEIGHEADIDIQLIPLISGKAE
ncbi:MAG: hypothetical protein HQ557_17815 [Bacteroidetes bacterium]|nr:hypothetical protein [Bacteroidota bacterium]